MCHLVVCLLPPEIRRQDGGRLVREPRLPEVVGVFREADGHGDPDSCASIPVGSIEASIGVSIEVIIKVNIEVGIEVIV